MKTKMSWVMALVLAGLGVWVVIPGCKKEEEQPVFTASEKAAAEKAAAEKALADKAAADKMAEDKSASDKAMGDKLIAAKAAADKSAADTKAEAAALPADLVVMKSELAQLMSQVDLTIAKLEVVSSATGSLKQPSQDAIASIDTLETGTQAIKQRAADMRDRGASYFDAWEKQLATVSTPEVAAIASKRKEELSAKYAEVLTSMQESKAAFDPFWADMQSIRATIKDGLTADTQKALVAQVKSVKDKAVTLKTRAQATSDKLNQVSVIYTQKP